MKDTYRSINVDRGMKTVSVDEDIKAKIDIMNLEQLKDLVCYTNRKIMDWTDSTYTHLEE